MTRGLFLFIFIFQYLTGAAQKATVSGVCLPCAGETLKLSVYDDLISYREVQVSESKVDESGHFELPFNFQEERYAWIETNKIRYDFFVSPGKDLKLELDLVIPNQQERELGLRGYFSLIPTFLDSEGSDFNRKIARFNSELDVFLEAQYKLIAIRKAPAAIGKAVKDFKHRMDSTYVGETGFFADYIKFAIAGVELTSKRKKDLMFKDYLKDQRMLYHNLEFMRFFEQFHADGLERQARYTKASEFKVAFDTREPDGAVQDLIMQDEYLQDVTHRQTFYIKGLGEIAASGLYDRKKVLGMLKRFSAYSSNGELAKAAKNVHWLQSRFLEGEEAPVFFANTINSDLVSDRTFRDGYVLLEFGRVGNPMSERETAILPSMMKDYPQMQVISFMVNEQKSAVTAFKEKYGLDWPVVKISEDSKIIKDFDLRSLPFYVVLDGEWRFVKYGVPEPSRGLEKELFRIQEKIREENKTRIGEK